MHGPTAVARSATLANERGTTSALVRDSPQASATETSVQARTKTAAISSRCQTGKDGGVLVAALQSEREEETGDRAERGSGVRGSDQASVAPETTPSRLTGATIRKKQR